MSTHTTVQNQLVDEEVSSLICKHLKGNQSFCPVASLHDVTEFTRTKRKMFLTFFFFFTEVNPLSKIDMVETKLCKTFFFLAL